MHFEEWKGWHAPGLVPATHPKLQNHSHADSGNDTVLLFSFSLESHGECKHNLSVSVALCKMYKQIMAHSLEEVQTILERGGFILMEKTQISCM